MTEKDDIIPHLCNGWAVAGVMRPILEEAQLAAIEMVFDRELAAMQDEHGKVTAKGIAGRVLDNAEILIAILSLEAPKQRKTRRDKGHPRTRKIAPLPQTKKQAAINAALQDGKQ